ncbi:TolC family protein [Flavihumibacter petaseus]|uniref:Putative RND-type efflux pump outer membrane protein n=1 Tax=Flavihumibacter petaseus NBRC 106054 TaxID=1220578 RepID=A0A0E9N2D9_9BACT|nr:TolC family protein [Flavihumibacter petaseus]GAO43836.1 putative RND-type efflux pump outer membrane protein [Flavihumibacter petaseus NBRC 106054]
MSGVTGKILFLFIFCFPAMVTAQDTLRINIRQADSIFLQNSYYLLAASMNIEGQNALVIQAKLYPNAVLTIDFNAWDPENNKILHAGKTGQKAIQLEQLIILGGKRKAEIEIAKTNAGIAALELEQTTRNLKYRLHSSLYAAGQQEFLLGQYNQQMTWLENLLQSYQVQADKGNIALKEVVRLKGAYLKLHNDRSAVLKTWFETQADLQQLMQVPAVIRFEFSEDDITRYIRVIAPETVQSTAGESRPDLLILKQQQVLANQHLDLQKRYVVPDLTVFSAYDQRGGAFMNQVNAGIALPLPFLNRNQGNIKAAAFQSRETGYQLKALENEVNSQVRNAYAWYNQSISEYRKVSGLYNADFDLTLKGMTGNFQKRNVSIMEFIDFFESYNDVITELTRTRTQLVAAAEELNRLAGKDLY